MTEVTVMYQNLLSCKLNSEFNFDKFIIAIVIYDGKVLNLYLKM